jgi:DNA-binding transcriptional regulator LsrR (DeoR family)
MRERREIELMLHCSRLYYENGQSQEEIAQALGISRPKVSRLLQRARDEGLVHIQIIDPFSEHVELEHLLEDTFGLKKAVVTAGTMGNEELTRRRIGWAASAYLEEALQDGQKVGIGWGRTLHATVESIADTRERAVSVIPLVGGLSRVAPSFQVNELARLLAEALGGTWQALYSPAFLGNDEERKALLNSPDVRVVTAQWAHLDIALVGIGHFGYQTELRMLFADYVDPVVQQQLEQSGAVGDICAHFYDIQGRPITGVGWQGQLGIGLEQLRHLDHVVGVAGSPVKADAILGALRGKYMDVLITDEPTARLVLERHQRGA